MKLEIIGGRTYKITLEQDELPCAPFPESADLARGYISDVIDELRGQYGVALPEGRLLVESFARSDGSVILFISELCVKSAANSDNLYGCDIFGAETLLRLLEALSVYETACELYAGSGEAYRLILREPPEELVSICTEFGSCCEITALFAAQTAEYTALIAKGRLSGMLTDISE
ncbi:MAG: hypothetical protein ACI4KM_02030 [Oscillospiraceae bacterium]